MATQTQSPLLTRPFGADLLARAAVGGLFALLSVNLLTDFIQTQRMTGLLLIVSESLVVVLTILRRRAGRSVDHRCAAVVTAASLVGPVLLRTAQGPGLLPDLATVVISAVGLIVVIAGKIALGRSFGIVPANRGVVIAGPYGIVRHPIYAGYVLTHVGFACAHPTGWNVALVVLTDAALMIRALYEERVLAGDRVYQTYCRRVAWHVVPGVF
jgi:protein-S-isoprenylcysteine O-methyltransferase Ste14